MTHRAKVEHDFLMRGVDIHLINDNGGDGLSYVVSFDTPPACITVAEAGTQPVAQPLNLPNDAARALYEALAEHFGHTGNDTRALRRDYDAERKRVDTLIGHLIGDSK